MALAAYLGHPRGPRPHPVAAGRRRVRLQELPVDARGALCGRGPGGRTSGQAGADPRPDVLLHRTPAAHRAATCRWSPTTPAHIAQHRAPHPDRDLDRRALLRTRRPVGPVPLPTRHGWWSRTPSPGSTSPHRVSCADRVRRRACSPSKSRWTNSPTRSDVDPLELRLRNDTDHDQASGKPWSGKHLRECYLQGAERFGWSDRPMAPRSLQRDGSQVGWGMATATYPGRTDARELPGHHRRLDGRVRFASATHEVGTGVRTVMTQVAADATGLPLSPGRASTRATRCFPTRPTAAPRRRRPPSAPRCTRPPPSGETPGGRAWRRSAGPADRRRLRSAALTFTTDQRRSRRRRAGLAVLRRALLRGRGRRADRPGDGDPLGRGDGLRPGAQPEAGPQPGDGRHHRSALGMALLEQVPYDAHTAQLHRRVLPAHPRRPAGVRHRLRRRPGLRPRSRSGCAASVRSAPAVCPRRSPMRSSTPPASDCATCRSRWRT